MARFGLARLALTAVVVLLLVVAQVQIWSAAPAYDAGGRALNAALAAAMTVPILLARRWPLPVALGVLVAVVLDQVLGGDGGYQWFVVVLVVYALGSHAGSVAGPVGAGVVAILVLVVDIPRLRDGAPVEEVLPGWAVLAGVYGLGRWLRHRRREVARLADRAVELERDQEAAAARAVDLERARIAVELHDLVAHSMAVIVLQAQAGRRVVGTDPAATDGALAAIESTGRSGMAELRRLLDVLHLDGEADDLDPRPGLASLPVLAQRVGSAGMPVTVAVEGCERSLPAGVDLSAYRIVQEALTNALRHAGRATASVGVTYGADTIELRISDDGTGTTDGQTGGGHGLAGMRERVRLFGGDARGRSRPDGRILCPGRTAHGVTVIRVLLADDEELVRTGLRLILGTEPGLTVVGEAANGREAVEIARSTEADVLLLDLRMPELDGLAVLRLLADVPVAVVVLTTFDTDTNVREALAAGAAGFLLKDAPADRLISAVRAAASGDAVLSRSVARRLANELASRPAARPLVLTDDLTAKEREVLALMADGCSNAEIAQTLHVVEGTVKTHVARILMKLGVRDRLQAVVSAYRSGMVG